MFRKFYSFLTSYAQRKELKETYVHFRVEEKKKYCSQETFSSHSVMSNVPVNYWVIQKQAKKKCLILVSFTFWIDVISTPVKIGIPCGNEELSAGWQINAN